MKTKLSFILLTFYLALMPIKSMAAIIEEPFYQIVTVSDDGKTLTFESGRGYIAYLSGTYPISSNYDSIPGWCSPKVTKVVFDGYFSPKSTAHWFHGCTNLTEIVNIENLHLDNTKNADYMFAGCSSLTSLDFSNSSLDSLVSCYNMFDGCSNLRIIYSDYWDILANMNEEQRLGFLQQSSDGPYMFGGCTSLVGGSGTRYMYGVANDYVYAHIDGGSSNPGYFTMRTSDVVPYAVLKDSTQTYYYDNMRYGRAGRKWAISEGNGTGASGAKKVVITPAFYRYSPSSLVNFFAGCSNAESIEGLEYLNTANATDMRGLFSGCSSLKTIDMSKLNTKGATDISRFFDGCSSLTSVDLSVLNTANVTDVSSMFRDCKGLVSLCLRGFNTSSVTSMYNMFYGCSSLKSIDLSGLNTSNVTSMSNMFYGCYNLESLDLSSFNTSKVTSMSGMFDGCSSLMSIDLSVLNTSNVTSMSNMFCGCYNLESLDVSSFNTSKVTSMSGMFDGCSGLISLNLSSFDTREVTSMHNMFYLGPHISPIIIICAPRTLGEHANVAASQELTESQGLEVLDLSSFDTSKVTDMSSMFHSQTALKTIYVSDKWNTGKVTYSNNMFNGCTSLVGGLGTSYDSVHVDKAYAHVDGGVSSPGYLTSNKDIFVYSGGTIPYCVLSGGTLTFYYDDKPESRAGKKYELKDSYSQNNCPEWRDNYNDINKVLFDASFIDYHPTSTAFWFYEMSKVTGIEGIENLQTDKVLSMEYMFYKCSSLTSLNLGDFDTSNVSKMRNMFCDCSSLKTLSIGIFDTSKVQNFWAMFAHCSSLTSLDVSSFDTSSAEQMGVMFWECSKLTTLNLKNFDMKKVFTTHGMFWNCSSLKTIIVNDNWNTSTLTSSTNMFTGCTSLVGGKGTKYSSSHIDKAYAHPDGGTGNPGYFTAKDGSDYTYTGGTIAYGVLSGGTITFYYDDKWNSRSGTKYVVKESQYSVSGKKPDWYEDRIKITRAVFDSTFVGYHPVSTACWFYECGKLKSVEGMEYLNTDEAKSLAGMFRFCYVLKDIDLSHFDTSNVTDMSFLFCYCQSLANIDVSTFNTEKVTDMQHMFHKCPVEVLDLSMFDTHNLVYTSTMFSGCSKLRTIYAKRGLWVNDKMLKSGSSYMFSGCNVLVGGMGTKFTSKHIDREYAIIDDGPTLNPGYLTDPLPAEKEAYAVYKNNVLTFYYDDLIRTRTGDIYRANLDQFRTKSDDGWAKHFNDAQVKTVVFDLSFGDYHDVTTTSYWFGHKDKSILTEFKGMQYFNTENVTDMSNMFIGCRALTAVDVSHFDTHNVTNMLGMFCYCTSIKTLDLTNFDTAKVLDMSFMFGECSSMTSVDVSSFDTGCVTTMNKMFYYCSSLPTLNILNFDTHSVKDMIGMFKSCYSLPVLDVSSFDTHNVEVMDDDTYGGMFEYCNKATTIYVGDGWSTAGLTSHGDLLFKMCTKLVGGAGTAYDPDHTDYTYAHVDGGASNPGYFTYKNTSGDVNGDGAVNVADIASIIDVMAGKGDEVIKKAADVNGDGAVNVADIASIISKMAELARQQRAEIEYE